MESPAIDTVLATSSRVEFAPHPHNGQWHMFFMSEESDAGIPRGLLTASVDPRTGAPRSEPVPVLNELGLMGTNRTPSR